MPFKSREIKLPREYDRRVKLSEEDKKNIVELYNKGLAIREIARTYEHICTRRMIQFVIFPERALVVKEHYKENRLDGRYYKKERHTKAIREHRKYKQNLFLKGKIK